MTEDFGEEHVATVVREQSLCLRCIARQTKADELYTDIMLQNLDEGGRIIRVTGRCAGCGQPVQPENKASVPSPGLGWCAWCGRVIRAFYVDDHGVRYHTACWAWRPLRIAGAAVRKGTRRG